MDALIWRHLNQSKYTCAELMSLLYLFRVSAKTQKGKALWVMCCMTVFGMLIWKFLCFHDRRKFSFQKSLISINSRVCGNFWKIIKCCSVLSKYYLKPFHFWMRMTLPRFVIWYIPLIGNMILFGLILLMILA
jgi:hypothetical protein